MKSHKLLAARAMRIAALPLILIVAGLYGQPTLAGGNSSGQPSGSTIAGSTTVPPAAVGALTNVITSGGVNVTTTQGTNSAGAATTTRTVSLPASTVANSFAVVGLSLPAPGASQTFVSASGVSFTVTNNNGTITISSTTTNA